jgi:hypothetical protein
MSTITQRKANRDSNGPPKSEAAALQQYAETEGHFSMVRYACLCARILRCLQLYD